MDCETLPGCGVTAPITWSWLSAPPQPPTPALLLVWNETYLEVSNGFGQNKRTAMLALLDRMLARGVPIQGIGLEAHLRAEQAAVLGDARL